jgi:fatty acid desaturase
MTADRSAAVTSGGVKEIPTTVNISLAICHAAINLYQFFILPWWLLPSDHRWAWTLLPLAVLSNPFWSLIHEAIHDLFHSNRKVNATFGRALSVMFGSPFRILRLSHLLHHKLNRTPIEATELYDKENSSLLVAASGYYFQILGGLYLVELVSPLLFFFPRLWVRKVKTRFIKPESVTGILMQNWTQEEAVREIRIDGLIILVWLGLSRFCYGTDWPLLAAVLVTRGFLISFLDNVYHYRTPVNEIFYAANLRLPKALARVLLNFNFHGLHHQNPAIPWIRLPGTFREQARSFQGNYFAAAARQLCGPVALQELRRAR